MSWPGGSKVVRAAGIGGEIDPKIVVIPQNKGGLAEERRFLI